MKLNILRVINKLRKERPVFFSESDLQFALSNVLREEYPKASIRLEYSRYVEPVMHLDILVVIDDKWYPIELKYKTKKCNHFVNGEEYQLKTQGAKDIGCYLYLKDIQRIENIKDNEPRFVQGYTIFITNDLAYTRKPIKEDSYYKEFSLENGITKTGILDWAKGTGKGTKKGNENPIVLKGRYPIEWKEYSSLDSKSNGVFMYLINEIK